MQTTPGKQRPEELIETPTPEHDHGTGNPHNQADHVLTAWHRAIGNHTLQRMSQRGAWPERLVHEDGQDK